MSRNITLNMDLLDADTAKAVAMLVLGDWEKARAEFERWEAGVPSGPEPVYNSGRKRPIATLEPSALAALRLRKIMLFTQWSKVKRYTIGKAG